MGKCISVKNINLGELDHLISYQNSNKKTQTATQTLSNLTTPSFKSTLIYSASR